MNEISNSAQRAKGAMKEKAGEVLNDRDMEAEGKADQSKADVKDAGEKVKDAGGKVKDAFKR